MGSGAGTWANTVVNAAKTMAAVRAEIEECKKVAEEMTKARSEAESKRREAVKKQNTLMEELVSILTGGKKK